MANGILWNNSDSGGTDDSAQVHVDAGAPLVSYSCVQGWPTPGLDGNINNDPLFSSAAGPDEAPLDPLCCYTTFVATNLPHDFSDFKFWANFFLRPEKEWLHGILCRMQKNQKKDSVGGNNNTKIPV